MIKLFKKNRKNGFTLIETLVSVSIFTLSVVASMVVLSSGVSNTIYAKNKVIATYLAQEGIEYVRNMRDTYTLYEAGGAQTGWNAFIVKLTIDGSVSTCDQPNGCYFGDLSPGDFTDPNQPIKGITISACGASCPKILYDVNTGKYNYFSGVTTNFSRKIKMTQINSNEIQISSTVSWSLGSKSFNVSLYENIFKWIE